MPIDITATLGLPGSASTWVFNVARELQLLHRGAGHTESFYSDAAERAWQVFKDCARLDRSVVWKLHEPDESWTVFLSESGAKLILSVRDPRDAVLSLIERFGETKDTAIDRVQCSITRVIESLPFPHLEVRYEDRFFDKPETIVRLAQYLDLTPDDADRARIFSAYQTSNIASFGHSIDELPANRVRKIEGMHYDETTQIHRSHIGNQRVGKWRDQFDATDRRQLTSRFRLFLDIFGYDGD